MNRDLQRAMVLLGLGSVLWFTPIGAKQVGQDVEDRMPVAMVVPVVADNATVYLKKAVLSSRVELSVPQGKSVWVLTNISDTIDESTLTISANQQVVVQTLKLMSVPVNTQITSEESQRAQKKLDAARAQQKLNDTELKVVDTKLALFNLKTDGIPIEKARVEAIEQMLALISEEMRPILVAKIRVEKAGEILKQNIQSLEATMQELKLRDRGAQVQQRLLVTLYAPEATKTTVQLSYFMDQAGWSPFYKVAADDDSDTLKIEYKANVFQNSGFDWENIQLTLSTEQPLTGAKRPQLFPWYVSIADEQKKPLKEARIPHADQQQGMQRARQNVHYPLKKRYTIFAGGHGYPVAIKSKTVAAQYNYVAMPRMNTDVFFQAQISEWKTLSLLSGRMHIYYKSSLVGEGYINTDQWDSVLTIPLGQRRDIVIKRSNEAKQVKRSAVKGTQVTQPYQFTLEAFNGYAKTIDLIIIDQIPLIRNSKIKRSRIKLGHSVYDEKNGTLTWRFDLPPNATKKINYAYTLKYPKDLEIDGL